MTVVSIKAARRRRLVGGQRLELPALEDLDSYIYLTERELSESRLKLAQLPMGSERRLWTLKDIEALRAELVSAQELRAVVVRRALFRVVRRG